MKRFQKWFCIRVGMIGMLIGMLISVGVGCTRIRLVPPSQVRALATIAVPDASQSAITSISDNTSQKALSSTKGQDIELTKIIEDLDKPVYLTHANDGSGALYIVEQAGKVRMYQNDQVRTAPFLDIGARVGSSGSEQGLLSIAFSPTYIKDGFFFVNYTDKDGDTIVSRFATNKDHSVGDAKSELRILKIDQPYANHNGGLIKFGPDGMLYIGMGDGGSAGDPENRAQNMKVLLGKLLRIDVSKASKAKPYAIPADNPKWKTGEKAEIWSSGLRNPWRFSFDKATGDLFIADVGQNAYEEVNFQPAQKGGANYGWKLREGFEKYDGDKQPTFTEPIAQYAHADGCSVTGGYVYRGTAIPGLAGAYLYGDYCQGSIWTLKPGADGKWQNEKLFDDNLRIASFGEDAAGELYVIDHGGVIYKMLPTR